MFVSWGGFTPLPAVSIACAAEKRTACRRRFQIDCRPFASQLISRHLMGELIKLVKEYQRTHNPNVGDSIVRIINPRLRLYLSLRSPKEWLDDLLQETLIHIFLGLDEFEASTDGQFHAYSFTIAHRRLVDALRRRGREPKYVFLETEMWEAIEAAGRLTKKQREQLAAVMTLLAAVRPPCVLYLMAHYVVGMTFEEMRKPYGFPSAAAARMATSRCLRLAKELGEE